MVHKWQRAAGPSAKPTVQKNVLAFFLGATFEVSSRVSQKDELKFTMVRYVEWMLCPRDENFIELPMHGQSPPRAIKRVGSPKKTSEF